MPYDSYNPTMGTFWEGFSAIGCNMDIYIERRQNMEKASLVLDACCGPKGFWFNKQNRRAIYMDKRKVQHEADYETRKGTIVVSPDIMSDYTCMPFRDETFHMVAFDPPHRKAKVDSCTTVKMYGVLADDWEQDMRKGFSECFRVLKPHGTLILKWNDCSVKIKKILALTEYEPLFGTRRKNATSTYWVTFMK